MAVAGGMTPHYQGDGRYKMALELQQKHPDVVKITQKWGRWQHQVDYRPFRKNKLRLKPGAVIHRQGERHFDGHLLLDVDDEGLDQAGQDAGLSNGGANGGQDQQAGQDEDGRDSRHGWLLSGYVGCGRKACDQLYCSAVRQVEHPRYPLTPRARSATIERLSLIHI